jgi:hypothetical protein
LGVVGREIERTEMMMENGSGVRVSKLRGRGGLGE